MANLRVSAIDAAVQTAVYNDASSNSGSQSHVYKPFSTLVRSPIGLGQSTGISVILNRDWNAESLCQIFDQIGTMPKRQKVKIPIGSAKRIYGAG
jgi:hypothetical protein